MTGNLVVDLAISLAGILGIVGLSWFLGAWRDVTLTGSDAHDRALLDEPDFNHVGGPEAWRVGLDGRAGFLTDGERQEALVAVRHGNRLVLRRVRLDALRPACDDCIITIRAVDSDMRPVRVRAPDAETASQWLGLLTAG